MNCMPNLASSEGLHMQLHVHVGIYIHNVLFIIRVVSPTDMMCHGLLTTLTLIATCSHVAISASGQ